MKKLTMMLAGAAAAAALAFGGVAAPASAAEVIPGPLPVPVQIDECGPEVFPDHTDWDFGVRPEGTNLYLSYFAAGKVIDGQTVYYRARYVAKPGYEFAAGVQTEFWYPAFTDVPCEPGAQRKAAKNGK